ncbi:hypothetical protein NM06_02490 [Vibrio sinaloensis]|uniref:Peptidase MA-like domain-containing protein n=2 Tax=Photobacterium sp. (strain ATCC 43367) TaxID=379097 RepID=A0A0A5I1X4_PHOS4|nr:hypothetical protein NM06_02490 [Vibrio sinaloensis]
MLLSVLTSSLLTTSNDLALTYQIKPNATDPSQVSVIVNTKALAEFQVLPARTMANPSQPPLICSNENGIQTSAAYDTNLQCDQISWTLTLAEIDQHGFDIAKQLDSYSKQKGWYFISEFNSLPRFTTRQQQPIEAKILMPSGVEKTLPSETQPPLFLLGGLAPISLDINGHRVHITTDNQQIVETIDQWKPVLESQLGYLVSLYPQNRASRWDIAFFERDKAARSASGAAGSDTILVNALVENGKLDADSMTMLLKIAAHESMHIINQSAPLWASESLAEYYAMKSLNNTPYAYANADNQWQQFKQSFPLASTGLLDAHKKVSSQGMQQYYPLFYVKGPAFWLSIDTVLTEAGSSLDKLVADFTFEPSGKLAPSSVERIVEIIGQQTWQKISNSYL